MLEIPESAILARQIDSSLRGRRVTDAIANSSPHRFAWYAGAPDSYGPQLQGLTIAGAQALAGFVRVSLGKRTILFGDGVSLRLYGKGERKPEKHQLCLALDDGSALVASIQMYGGIWLFDGDNFDNPYYRNAIARPSPFSKAFTQSYFRSLPDKALILDGKKGANAKTLSAKAFLATEQRIPGLGNGVLQDILWNAETHPKAKIADFSEADWERLHVSLVSTLSTMLDQGGRDTERDLFGNPGGYTTIASKNTVGTICPRCGDLFVKEAYMGGSVYFCPSCQKK